MKITEIECLVIDGEYPYVIIETDEGITGIGECFRRSPWVTKSAVDTIFRDAILSMDPSNYEEIWDVLYNIASTCGPYGSLLTAISGIDTAVWDINLKREGVPLHKKLGKKIKKSIPIYASSMKRDMSPEEEADRASFFYEEGFLFYKMHSAYPEEVDSPRDKTLKTVEAIRNKLDNNIEIMVDVNGGYSVNKAIEVGHELEKLEVFQFEQPVHVTDLEGLKRVTGSLSIPIASGECCYTVQDFKNLIEKGNPDILQPDVIKTGGITEFRKIISFLNKKEIMIHNTQPLISTAIHLHFLSINNSIKFPLEYNIEQNSLINNPITKNSLNIESGNILVPDDNSFGLDFDISIMKKRAKII